MNLREALHMTTAGASFTVCIPAAFVTFSSSGTNNLRRGARARIIAAGPFHNFAVWCILALLIRFGITNFSLIISGYKNVSTMGKAIVDVKTVGSYGLCRRPLYSFPKGFASILASSSRLDYNAVRRYLTFVVYSRTG